MKKKSAGSKPRTSPSNSLQEKKMPCKTALPVQRRGFNLAIINGLLVMIADDPRRAAARVWTDRLGDYCICLELY